MKAISRLFSLVVFILFPQLAHSGIAGLLPPQDSSNVRTYLDQGNEFSERLFKNQSALQSYFAALALESNNDEILWRISRTYVDLGEHLPIGTDEEKRQQLATYEMALEYANKALAVDPRCSMAYVRRAIANGRIALFKGVWESLDLVKQAKTDLERAIELDAANSSAYYVLGRTHAKVSERPRIVRWPLGLGWASLDDAVEKYEQAIALRPNFIRYRLDCARAYVELDEYEKARAHLTSIPTLPTMDEDDDQFRKEATELLERIREKD